MTDFKTAVQAVLSQDGTETAYWKYRWLADRAVGDEKTWFMGLARIAGALSMYSPSAVCGALRSIERTWGRRPVNCEPWPSRIQMVEAREYVDRLRVQMGRYGA